MIQVRKSNDRGFADHGWLKSMHSFSFADYYDPGFMGFSVLRVINEDRIEGGQGFGTHGHRDMEIVSYVIDGALEHKDSMGNSTIIYPGELQRMSAGAGVRHSEYNHRTDRQSHFLQIWILPEEQGIQPGYDQKSFAAQLAQGSLVLVASKSGRDGSVTIHQDVEIHACKSATAGAKELQLRTNRKLWIQIIKGELQVSEAATKLTEGDGAAIQGTDKLDLSWTQGSEFLVFDMP